MSLNINKNESRKLDGRLKFRPNTLTFVDSVLLIFRDGVVVFKILKTPSVTETQCVKIQLSKSKAPALSTFAYTKKKPGMSFFTASYLYNHCAGKTLSEMNSKGN